MADSTSRPTKVADRQGIDDSFTVEPGDFAMERSSENPKMSVASPLPEPESGGQAQSFEPMIVRTSPQLDKLALALAKAQVGFGELKRTKKSTVKLKAGGQYTHNYETLADVIKATVKPLSENGLAVMQFPFVRSARQSAAITIRTMLVHESGQWLYNDLTASIYSTAPQDVGTGQTYLMRYARKAILGISADDDDDENKLSQVGESSEVKQGRRLSEGEQPAPAARQPAKNIGRMMDVKDLPGGGIGVCLETGFKAATRDEEIARALRGFKKVNATVELVTRASSNPKHAPIIEEARIVKR